MMFTDIEKAIDWITSQRNTSYSFSHFKEVCHLCKDPQNDFYMIHVAGTDGKGSTVDFLRALLMKHGFKVGTFTSPHYLIHQDRIRVNDHNITDEAFLRILNQQYSFFTENHLSMFEMDYLIMCQYFKEEKIDMAIIETGLGGRLDSTNVVDHPALSIITTIGYDHMDRLGNTLAQICKEKCGIIKKDSKVLIGHLNKECKNIVKEYASSLQSEYYELGNYEDLGKRLFAYKEVTYELKTYADYQKHNASLAIEAFEIVAKDYGFETDPERMKEAIKNALWHCRFEIVKEKPRVILDGAHNIHGIEALVSSFDHFDGSKCIIFSALKRKEYQKMIDLLRQHTDQLIITTFPNNEVIDLNDFASCDTDPDYSHAIEKAMKHYENVLICGSLYFMSKVVQNVKF